MYLYEKLEQERKRREKQIAFTTPPPPPPEKRFVSLMTSMSHTYGNALAFIENWVLDLFPKDGNGDSMFKTIHVNSKIAHRQIRSTNKEFLKKSKPMIIFRPRIAPYDEDRFLQGTPLITRQADIHPTWGGGSLLPFLDDPQHDIAVKFQLNRVVFYVDVIIILETLMEQIDYRHYLENAIRWDQPFNLRTAFESFMPQEMLSILGDCCGVPLYDDNGNVADFLKYMNQHSAYPITYKFRGASGTKEFFRYYPVTVETTLSSLSTDEGEQVGSIMDSYQLDFTIKMEFYSNGFYYIYSNSHDIKMPLIKYNNTELIPTFTDVLSRADLNLDHGWHLYNRGAIRLEDPNDSLCIDSLLNNSIRLAIDYHLKNNMPLCDLIDLRVRKQGRLARYGREYTVDWSTRTVQFINQDTFHTFSFQIIINLEYINNLIKTIYNLK